MALDTATVSDGVPLTLDELGSGRAIVVIHGGGGPRTMGPLVTHLAGQHHVLAPTLPGWDGTPRPDALRSVGQLADTLTQWLADTDLNEIVVVGSSLGGWVAAELAIRDRGIGRIAGVAILDGVGAEIPSHPMRDFFSLDPRGIAEYSWHDPQRGFLDPATLTDAQRQAIAANMSTLRLVAGERMLDPTLLGRISDVTIPTLVLWGAADRIVAPEYGRAYAAAFANAQFKVIEQAGHLPHLEQPEATLATLDEWLGELNRRPAP